LVHVPGFRCDNRGVYREIAPPADLAAHLACVWTSVSRGGVILPDGCVDLVWRGDALVVAGPATGPAAGATPGVPVFGVRFRLGVAGTVLGRPAAEVLDSTVPLDELWGRGVEERVAEGGPAALLAEVRARLAPLDRLARAAALAMARPDARVDALELGVSERQLRRRFIDAVGYGPKTLARVLRFQRFLALAQTELTAGAGALGVAGAGGAGVSRRVRVDLARLALDAGYADQAHLTRECRRLSGRTPVELVASGVGAAGERVRFVQAAGARGAYRAA
jgi:AraC-like DNA-binding protein